MRISHLITLTACTFSVIFLLGCSENSKKATDAGKSFLTNMYTCNFKECDALCTEKGKEEVHLFASNLTEDDLALISKNIEIEAEDCDITDHSASVTYTAKNVIVCDSLDDAVKMAYERYGEIRELAAAGEYLNRKREPVDYLIAAAADAAEAFKRIGDVPKHFITHIHEEIEAARDRMEGQLWQ